MTHRRSKRGMIGVIALVCVWLLLVFVTVLFQHEIVARRSASHLRRAAMADQIVLSLRDLVRRDVSRFAPGDWHEVAAQDFASSATDAIFAAVRIERSESEMWAEVEARVGSGSARATRSIRWRIPPAIDG